MKKLKLLIPTLTISLSSVCVALIATSCDEKIDGITIIGPEDVPINSTGTTYTVKGYKGDELVPIDNAEIEWSIQDDFGTGAKIDQEGRVTTYGIKDCFHIIAKLKSNTDIAYNKTVTIVSPVSSIEIKELEVGQKIYYGKDHKFEANVEIIQGYKPSVTWTLEDLDETGSRIDSKSGVFVAGSDPGKVKIIATSDSDPDAQDEYIFEVSSHVTKLELIGYDGVFIGDEETVYQIEIETDTDDKEYTITFEDPDGTGADFDEDTCVLNANMTTPGEVNIVITPNADTAHPKRFPIQINDHFTEYEVVGNEYAIVKSFNKKVSSLRENAISTEYDGLPVTEIGEDAFFKAKLKSLTIPSSITSIGQYAFYLSDLSNVQFENDKYYLTKIDDHAFAETKIKNFVLPTNKMNLLIEQWAFNKNIYLENCDLSKSLDSRGVAIKEEAFAGCSNLRTLSLPPFIGDIPRGLCKDCELLQSIRFPETITTIWSQSFKGCKSLKTISYDGTIMQWKTISKYDDWHDDVPALSVQCKDGPVDLD